MVLQPPDRRGRDRGGLGRKLAPWAGLTAVVGVLAVALGVPWWIAAAVAVVVLLWIVIEP